MPVTVDPDNEYRPDNVLTVDFGVTQPLTGERRIAAQETTQAVYRVGQPVLLQPDSRLLQGLHQLPQTLTHPRWIHGLETCVLVPRVLFRPADQTIEVKAALMNCIWPILPVSPNPSVGASKLGQGAPSI